MDQEPLTVDITPVGMRTPEGAARTHKAMNEWHDAQASVANKAMFFFRDHSYEIAQTFRHDEDAKEEIEELDAAFKVMAAKQDEFLRAVAGR